MPSNGTNVVILGSTGSIGRSSLEVISASNENLNAFALSFHRNKQMAIEQAKHFEPVWLISTSPESSQQPDFQGLPRCDESVRRR